jgi:AcrR family transcriptional regulator
VAVGRPREFDPDQVEDAAMKLFWRHGFAGVSISDVAAEAGVNRRGIYDEFGCKENLFTRATERYLAGPNGYLAEALTRPTAREVAEAALHGAADLVSGDIRGCLTTVGEAPGLPEQREATVCRLAERLDVAVAEGELPGVDPVVVARWIVTLIHGISVQARSGATRAELHAVADLAMAGWPGDRP